jgi:hypothetical protein
MGMLLTATAVLVVVVLYFGSRLRLLAAYVDAERTCDASAGSRLARPHAFRQRPRPVRTGRLARLGHRRVRARDPNAFA